MQRKPPVWVLTEREAIQFADEFLSDRRTTLWGRSFDIVNHTTRQEAILYLRNLIVELGFVEIIADPEIRSSSIEYN